MLTRVFQRSFCLDSIKKHSKCQCFRELIGYIPGKRSYVTVIEKNKNRTVRVLTYLKDVSIVLANSLCPCSCAVIAKSLKYSQRFSKTFPMIPNLISALKKCLSPLFAISSHKYTSNGVSMGQFLNLLFDPAPSMESPTRIQGLKALFTTIS